MTTIAHSCPRLAAGLAAGLLLTACGGGGSSNGDPDPLPTTPPPFAVGLESRPRNPDCVASDVAPSGDRAVELVDAYPSLPAFTQPLWMVMPPVAEPQWYVVQKTGEIIRFNNDPAVSTTTTALDHSATVDSSPSEGGLLGLTFHPDFANNGYAYLYYTAGGPLRSRLSRMTVDASGNLDAGTELVLLEIDQPAGNHNGGTILFGPDGYLYWGLGDGGGGGDPQGNGQNPNTLLGAMLRLDVDNPQAGGPPYSIPPDNPFVGQANRQEEIYATGLRNPYRWSFDSLTGELWAADVGQASFEEVSIIRNGRNYGWNTMEAYSCFQSSSCSQVGLELPVAAYPRSTGRSVTGGYVYRGNAIPGLRGRYVFGDFVEGLIWAIPRDAGLIDASDAEFDTSMLIAAFGQDSDGELYALNIQGGAGTAIQKLVPATPAAPPADGVGVPEQLSDTGCVNMSDPTTPASGTVPYEPNARFWSDGAVKYRAAGLPDGAQVEINDNGDFLFPRGSVLIKHFELAGQVFETRLYMHHQVGWRGYSYRWNDTRTEAFLLETGFDEQIAGQSWHYPSRSECEACHTAAANVSLGLETAQLNRDFRYPRSGTLANQLDTLGFIDWPDRDFTESERATVLPDPEDTNLPVADRAKAYLHTNCAQCHRPGGPTNVAMDLRFDTPLADMNVCDVRPQGDTLGSDANRLFAPGASAQSLLTLRMQETGNLQMPPVGVNVVDDDGVALLAAWIDATANCP